MRSKLCRIHGWAGRMLGLDCHSSTVPGVIRKTLRTQSCVETHGHICRCEWKQTKTCSRIGVRSRNRLPAPDSNLDCPGCASGMTNDQLTSGCGNWPPKVPLWAARHRKGAMHLPMRLASSESIGSPPFCRLSQRIVRKKRCGWLSEFKIFFFDA